MSYDKHFSNKTIGYRKIGVGSEFMDRLDRYILEENLSTRNIRTHHKL